MNGCTYVIGDNPLKKVNIILPAAKVRQYLFWWQHQNALPIISRRERMDSYAGIRGEAADIRC
ncbi:hypothetical protein LR69_04379 [Geobacillus sp. BCO2]|nr:hypothetical protein LR69_04379 [Geobacillus sp. BCO2]